LPPIYNGLSLFAKAERGKSGHHRASYFLTGREQFGDELLTASAAENNFLSWFLELGKPCFAEGWGNPPSLKLGKPCFAEGWGNPPSLKLGKPCFAEAWGNPPSLKLGKPCFAEAWGNPPSLKVGETLLR